MQNDIPAAPCGGKQGPQKPLPLKAAEMGNPRLDDEDCLGEMPRRWYGYGRWDAPYWFIGPEPGMDPGGRHGLKARCEAWLRLGGDELVDCRDHHFEFTCYLYHREDPRPRTNPTWRQLIRFLLACTDPDAPNIEDIRKYQQKRWGMKDGQTCLIELSPLAKAKLVGPVKHGLVLEERIEIIRRRIHQHNPKLVVMYGVLQRAHWEKIAGQAFPPDGILCVGSTLAVFAKAPTTHGLQNSYWVDLAKKVRDHSSIGPCPGDS